MGLYQLYCIQILWFVVTLFTVVSVYVVLFTVSTLDPNGGEAGSFEIKSLMVVSGA